MEQTTQKTSEQLTRDILETVLNNVNTAICFYQNRATTAMRISLEETVIENLTFIALVADHYAPAYALQTKLIVINEYLIKNLPIPKIELASLFKSENLKQVVNK